MTRKIAVIIGSTRPTRIGADIADWLVFNVSDTPDTNFEIVDLGKINLPFLDEPRSPKKGNYVHDHTKQWKAIVDSYDAYIFVTAEYNAGYPAPLKNAIDYLGDEWRDKPATIVSYGWTAGASASAQLRQVLERLKMRPTGVSPALSFDADTFDEQSQLKDVNASFDSNVDELKMATNQLIELIETK